MTPTLVEKSPPTASERRRDEHSFNAKDWKKLVATMTTVGGLVIPSHVTNSSKLDDLQAQVTKAATEAEASKLAAVRLEGKVDALTNFLTEREREKRHIASGVPTNTVNP